MNKLCAALSALTLTACAAPEQKWGAPQPLSDGGQIAYLQIAIVEYPTKLQIIHMCKPQGLPQISIELGCTKRNGGTDVIHVMHGPRNGDRIVNHYDGLTQWGYPLWHLSDGRH